MVLMKDKYLSVFAPAKGIILIGILAVPLSSEAGNRLSEAGFPLGRIELPEARTKKLIRPGVTYVHVERGWQLERGHWAIVSNSLTEKSVVDSLKADLQKSGLRVQEDWFEAPRGDDMLSPRGGGLYCFLSAGDFASREDATEFLAKLTCGGPLQVRRRASLPSWTTGPWTFDIVIIDPRQYHGRIVSAREPGLARTSEISRKHHAVVGINAGFFDGYTRPGSRGRVLPNASGTSIIQGKWYNEPKDGQVVFIESDKVGWKFWVERSYASTSVPIVKWADGKTAPLTGINRTLRAANELIAMRPEIFEYWQKVEGIPTEPLFVRVSKNGDLAQFSQAQELTSEDLVLLGTGCWKRKLGAALASGERLEVSLEIPRRPTLNAFYVGPVLISGGTPRYHDRREGRTARTAIGTDADGKIYLVTIDGHQYDPPAGGGLGSVGASISEVREVMRFLGAVDAVNLNGGGHKWRGSESSL